VEKEQSEDPAGSGVLPRRLNAKNELQFFVSPRKAKYSAEARLSTIPLF